MKRRIVIAITGASGSTYGVRLLEELAGESEIETHLIVSKAGYLNIKTELGVTRSGLEGLADTIHLNRDIAATIASGSFKTDAMIVAPCSMHTLAAIALGLSDSLIARAADVTLKERRRLVLLTRETPLNLAHLRNMAAVTEMGGVIFPPMPAFYAGLETLEAMVDQTVARVLDLINVESRLLRPWAGLNPAGQDPEEV